MPRLLPRLSGADRTAFLAAARSLIGVPFRHQGRTLAGVDCVGLCVYALGQIGVACEDLAAYSERPDGEMLRAKIEAHLGPPVQQWKPGDIALMRWHERNGVVYSTHVGILGLAPYGNRWTLIHSYKNEKRVTEHALDGHWPRRIEAVYSLTGEAA